MAREFEFEISYAIQNGQTEMAMLWREELNQCNRDREHDASDPYREHRERYYDEYRAATRKVLLLDQKAREERDRFARQAREAEYLKIVEHMRRIKRDGARYHDDLRIRQEADQKATDAKDEDAIALAEYEARVAADAKRRAANDALQEEIDRANARHVAAWQTKKQRGVALKAPKSRAVHAADSRKKPEPQHWRSVTEQPDHNGSHEAAVAFCGREIKCFDECGDEDPHIDVNALYLQADAFEIEPVSQAISAAGWAVIAKRKRAKRAKEREA